MKHIIASLSIKTEFILVIGFSFGYFILGSIFYVLAPPTSAPITGNHLLSLIIFEPIILVVVFWFLKQRGWVLDDLKLQPSLQASICGILLAICGYLAYTLVWVVASIISPEFVKTISQVSLVSNDLGLINIFAASIINPLFEELLVVGYVITALQQVKGMTYAVNVSVAVRLLYHLYQGPIAVMSIIPLGLIFAYWYAKKEKLWSVIIAHALFDFFALYSFR
jgi:uncharacterized protein